MGRTTHTADVARPLEDRSAATESVLGTYLHGLFENETVRTAFCDAVFRSAGRDRPESPESSPSPYADAAALVGRIDLPLFE
jgi:adenosylcobyric acid synthase